MRVAVLLIAAALVLSGCASASNCAGWRPINPSSKERLTVGTKRQILAHNEFWEKQCRR